MKPLLCLLGRHRPYVDESVAEIVDDPAELDDLADMLPPGEETESLRELADRIRAGDKVRGVFGPIRRYCGRCGEALPGDLPLVGDLQRIDP